MEQYLSFENAHGAGGESPARVKERRPEMPKMMAAKIIVFVDRETNQKYLKTSDARKMGIVNKEGEDLRPEYAYIYPITEAIFDLIKNQAQIVHFDNLHEFSLLLTALRGEMEDVKQRNYMDDLKRELEELRIEKTKQAGNFNITQINKENPPKHEMDGGVTFIGKGYK